MGKNSMKSISCYVMANRLQGMIDAFQEDGGDFDLVIETGFTSIGKMPWRKVRMEIRNESKWGALAACEWMKAATQFNVIFTNNSR